MMIFCDIKVFFGEEGVVGRGFGGCFFLDFVFVFLFILILMLCVRLISFFVLFVGGLFSDGFLE